MNEDVKITDITLSEPRFTEPDLERGQRKQWSDIHISLKNENEQKTVHVISQITNLDYDPANRTLFLSLVGSRPDTTNLHHTIAPTCVAVRPNKSATIKVAIPLIMSRFIEGKGLGGIIEQIDLTNLEHVTCRIGWGFSPVSKLWTASFNELKANFTEWENTIESTFDVKLPAKREE